MNEHDTHSSPPARPGPRPFTPKSGGAGYRFLSIKDGQILDENKAEVPFVSGELTGHNVEWDEGNPANRIKPNWRLKMIFERTEAPTAVLEVNSNNSWAFLFLAEEVLSTDRLPRSLTVQVAPGENRTSLVTLYRWDDEATNEQGEPGDWVWIDPRRGGERRFASPPGYDTLDDSQKSAIRGEMCNQAAHALREHAGHGPIGRKNGGKSKQPAVTAPAPAPAAQVPVDSFGVPVQPPAPKPAASAPIEGIAPLRTSYEGYAPPRWPVAADWHVPASEKAIGAVEKQLGRYGPERTDSAHSAHLTEIERARIKRTLLWWFYDEASLRGTLQGDSRAGAIVIYDALANAEAQVAQLVAKIVEERDNYDPFAED